MIPSIGLDFGTTNSVGVLTGANGGVETLRFDHRGEALDTFRSVLCFWETQGLAAERTASEAGPRAIDQFLELAGDCRFIQSFKSFAASPLFSDTLVFTKRMTFEALLTAFLNRMARHGGQPLPKRVIIGRPVTFAGSAPDERLARTRYETALRDMGFEEIHHVYEPVAAAYFFAQRLKRDATILVADFGGGTSDFSIVRFAVSDEKLSYHPLAHAGVGIAGDAFDMRVIENVVARAFGKDSEYVSWGKVLPVPHSYYKKFSRWNELSIMRHTKDFRELQQLARASLDPDRLNAFIAFLEADAGYALNRAVSAVKLALSDSQQAAFSFHTGGVKIERDINRRDFEGWIAPELEEIASCVDEALAKAGLGADEIDRVFLTGGTSFVPAVRAQFEARFGAEKIETGDQLVSIANGLALIAQAEDISAWEV